MRDPRRIKPMLKSLELLWKKHPDLRLGQLIEICHGESGSSAPLFSVEDNIMQLGIVEYYKKSEGNNMSLMPTGLRGYNTDNDVINDCNKCSNNYACRNQSFRKINCPDYNEVKEKQDE